MPKISLNASCLCAAALIVPAIYLFSDTALPLASAQSGDVKPVAANSTTVEKPEIDEKHPLFKLLEVAYKARKQAEGIDDYECVFAKQEMLGKKLVKTTMNMKFREKPFSVYLKFQDLNKGREVLFVQGKNNNNLLVREAGIKSVIGTLELAPTSTDVMAENKYPITQIGMKNLLNTIIKQWETEADFAAVTTQKRAGSKLPTGETCTVFEAVHEKPFKEFKFHTTRLWVEDETGLAIGVQQLAFPGKNDKEPPLVEEYFYGKLKANAKLTDTDFDRSNSSYAFK